MSHHHIDTRRNTKWNVDLIVEIAYVTNDVIEAALCILNEQAYIGIF